MPGELKLDNPSFQLHEEPDAPSALRYLQSLGIQIDTLELPSIIHHAGRQITVKAFHDKVRLAMREGYYHPIPVRERDIEKLEQIRQYRASGPAGNPIDEISLSDAIESAVSCFHTDGAMRAPIATKIYGFADKDDYRAFEVEAREPEGGKRITAHLRPYTLLEALTPNEQGFILPVYMEVNFDVDYPYAKIDWTEIQDEDGLFGPQMPRRFMEAAICATPKLTLF